MFEYSCYKSKNSMYRLTIVIIDIANHMLFKPVSFIKTNQKNGHFLNICSLTKVLTQSIKAISSIKNPSILKFHFQNESVPIISYIPHLDFQLRISALTTSNKCLCKLIIQIFSCRPTTLFLFVNHITQTA